MASFGPNSVRLVLLMAICLGSPPAVASSVAPADERRPADSGFLGFVERLELLPLPARQAAVDSFLAQLAAGTAPLTGDSLAHFIYRGPGQRLALAGDLNDWSPTDPLRHVPGTDFWHLTLEFPPTARLDYKLVKDGTQWLLDPLNRRQCTGGFGPNSELAMPAYVDPPEIVDHGHPRCEILTHDRLFSPQLGNERTVKLVLPPGFDAAAGHPVLIVHDGLEFITLGSLDRVLAHLAAGQPDWLLPVCVCVPPVDRTEEYAGTLREAFGDFLVETVLPLVTRRLGIDTPEKDRLGSLGASNGGAISLFLACRFPDRFGRLALMSPYVPADLLDGVTGSNGSSPMIYLNWGRYDLQKLIPLIERFRDRLAVAGIPHLARRYPEGHSWGLWRATIDEGLEFLFGSRPVRPPRTGAGG